MIFSLLLLSVSLSLDALFAGFAYGLDGTRVPFSSMAVICLFSIFYSGLAVFAGSAAARFLPPAAGRAFGAAVLALIGISMLVKAARKRAADTKESGGIKDPTVFRLILRPLGITIQILRNPDAVDLDRSGSIDPKEAVFLGSALSIDAVGVGLGSALSGLSGWYVPLSVGLFQLLFLSAGLFFGARLGVHGKTGGKIGAFLPGAMLIALAVVRLV